MTSSSDGKSGDTAGNTGTNEGSKAMTMSKPTTKKDEQTQDERDGNEGVLLDEHGKLLDPPLLLVSDIVRMKLLEKAKTRRVQEMIEQGVLPARKATREEELTLLRNNRVRSLTVKGIYVIEPQALEYARQHRKSVGFPKGTRRPRRGTKTGAGEDRTDELCQN